MSYKYNPFIGTLDLVGLTSSTADGLYLKLTGGTLTGNFGVQKDSPFFSLVDTTTGSVAGFSNLFMQAAEGTGFGERYGLYYFDHIDLSDDSASRTRIKGDGSIFSVWASGDGTGTPDFYLDSTFGLFKNGVYSGLTGIPGTLGIYDSVNDIYQTITASDGEFQISGAGIFQGNVSAVQGQFLATKSIVPLVRLTNSSNTNYGQLSDNTLSFYENTSSDVYSISFDGTKLSFGSLLAGNKFSFTTFNMTATTTATNPGDVTYTSATPISGSNRNGGGWTLKTGSSYGNGFSSIKLQGILANQGTGTTQRNAATMVTVGNTALLKIEAGSTTAPPLLLTSGTSTTTAVDGAFEYDGTNLFFTRASTTRENVLVAVDNASSPSTSVGVAIVNYYGSSATNFLGTPNRWISVNIAGSVYKIPMYT